MLKIGPLAFHLYGLLIGLGVLIGAWAAEKVRQKLAVENKEFQEFTVGDGLVWAIIGGIVGARLYHVIDFWGYYQLNLGQIMLIWEGGLGIYGAVGGGLVGLFLYSYIIAETKKRLINIWRRFLNLTDVMVIGLALGQAIGRWGNYFNQEIYGWPTDLPWGIYIKPENRLSAVMEYQRFHPLFLYESLWDLVVFLLLMKITIKLKKITFSRGMILVTYLGLYGLGRFWLEFLRIENWQVYGLGVAQWISLFLIVTSLRYWLKLLIKNH